MDKFVSVICYHSQHDNDWRDGSSSLGSLFLFHSKLRRIVTEHAVLRISEMFSKSSYSLIVAFWLGENLGEKLQIKISIATKLIIYDIGR